MILKNLVILVDGKLTKKDIEIKDGIYTRIEDSIPEDGLDMHSCYLTKGMCDIHVHFREPGFVSKESIHTGSLAAAKGGYTTVFLMPNLNPVPDNLEHLKVEEDIIKKDSVIESIPYASVSVGEKGNEVSDIDNLMTHTKYFSDDGVGFHDYSLLRTALKKIKDNHLFIASHAEDSVYKTKPEGEYIAVEHEIEIAKELNAPYHFCHMSTKQSFDLISKAQKEGYKITCEVTPHHLFLDEDDIKGNPNFKMNPPLRSKEDQKATLDALLSGVATIIATDHAPHTAEEKSREYDKCPNGIIGIETAAPLVYTKLVKTGIITLKQMEDFMCNNPRKLMGLKPLEIKVGEEASFTCMDLDNPHTYSSEEILSKGKNSPFIGTTLYGFSLLTVYKGNIVYKKEN